MGLNDADRDDGTLGEVDLYDRAMQLDGYPTYRRLRDEAPVHHVPGTNSWVVSRYDDVLHVLRHQDVFRTGGPPRHSPAAAAVYEHSGWEPIAPLSTDPPEHRRYRSVIDGFFDSLGATRWQRYIQDVVDDLLDEIEDAGACEFVEAFARPLPVRVITHVLGFPAEDIPKLTGWSAARTLPFAGGLTPEREVWAAEQVVELQRYIHGWIEEKRRHPGDDVLTALSGARVDDGRPLTDHEIITMTDHLFVGGNETTTVALASAVWILLREPGLYELLRDRPELIEVFVEEAMRLESPTQGAVRFVAGDTTLAGVDLPAGAVVHLRYGSANRDERMFERPDEVDLGRTNLRRHMAFSLGEHHCPGHGLSRLEQRLALDTVLRRLPELRLAEGDDVVHAPGFVPRALHALRIEWRPVR